MAAVAATKPTLKEIAAMPYPASVQAMRQHYNPMWGRGKDGELQTFKVTLDYAYRVSDVFECEVEAVDEEDAIEVANLRFDEDCHDADEDDCEIVRSKAVLA